MILYSLKMEPIKGWREDFCHPDSDKPVVFKGAADALLVAHTLMEIMGCPIYIYWFEGADEDYEWYGNTIDLREYLTERKG